MLIGSQDECTDAGSPRDGHDRQHSNSPTRLATHTSVWRRLWPEKCPVLYGSAGHVASMYAMQRVSWRTQPATHQRAEWQKVSEWTIRQALWLSRPAQSRRHSVLVASPASRRNEHNFHRFCSIQWQIIAGGPLNNVLDFCRTGDMVRCRNYEIRVVCIFSQRVTLSDCMEIWSRNDVGCGSNARTLNNAFTSIMSWNSELSSPKMVRCERQRKKDSIQL